MKTMTLRNIPDEVTAFISNRADADGRSFNATTLALLTEATVAPRRRTKRRDLSWLCGEWSDNERRQFDKTVSACRRIDSGEWK